MSDSISKLQAEQSAFVARVERQRNPGRRYRMDRAIPGFRFAQSGLRNWLQSMFLLKAFPE
jgi:hypothetical protein